MNSTVLRVTKAPTSAHPASRATDVSKFCLAPAPRATQNGTTTTTTSTTTSTTTTITTTTTTTTSTYCPAPPSPRALNCCDAYH